MNALANAQVAECIKENFVATYLKVGTFQIVGGQKVGGNIASYFCLPSGAVVHIVPGKVDGNTLLSEARWALETHKLALTLSTNLVTGEKQQGRYEETLQQVHEERVGLKPNGAQKGNLKAFLRQGGVSQQGQANLLLSMNPLPPMDQVYPIVWERILGEKLSALPVVRN